MQHLRTFYLAILVACFGTIGCGDQQAADDTAMEDTAMTDMGAEPMDGAPGMAMAGDTLRANLMGTAEVPGPGDEDGSGEATVWVENTQVCYEIEVEGIADATAAHIHTGAEGEAGSPVVDFNVPENGLSGCVDAETQIIEDIQSNPSEYYVNVHNEEFGAGAVRGQLG